ncbi:hypothetical protein IX339_001847 [Porphyromonas levii]|uniref:FimB/Mfa2 family fimbrial subunit n=1 Tax=Porphyromonas levii TaxID=28114 RepID=UPI001B8D7D8F|nr:FimB/Mfa2 family fimbrial subunit [Porphyromonas levii]MBR8732378.1 hypothetical protein [Porphyromonas levii]
MNRTNTLFTKGLALFALLSLLPSCVLQDAREVSTDKVYFTFNIGSALSHQGGVRVHDSTAPQINQDNLDFEDRVERLAVFVFDNSTSALAGSVFTSATSFKLKIDKPGTYDFYFIANYIDQPVGSPDRVEEFDTRTKVEAYLVKEQLKGDTFFSGIKGSGAAMPMARVYKSQKVDEGGTYMAPKPFYPTVVASGKGQLKPVSSFGDDYQSAISQKTVNLVRACAKIALSFRGLGAQSIASVKYNNVATDYTFMEIPRKGSAGAEQTMTTSPFDPDKPNEPITARAYVPERLFDVAPTWDSRTTNGINYITITMKSGKVYEVPLITANDILATQDYMTIATSNAANYSIIRNHYYILDINIPQDGKELDIALKVMPWDLVESQMSYERPEYFLEIIKQDNEGKYTTTPLTDINQEITLDDISYGKVRGLQIRFKINKPIGAIWTATITNGRDFKMSGDVSGVINDGIVTGQGEWHTFTITPRNPFETEPRYTQFYITVEGKELYLGFKDDGKGNMIPDNRFISDGSSEKWQIKQIGRTI